MTQVIRQIYLSTVVTGEFLVNLKSLIIAAVLGTAGLSSMAATHDSFSFNYTGPGTIVGFGGVLTSVDRTDIFSNVTLDGVAFGTSLAGGKAWNILSGSDASTHVLAFDYTGSAALNTSGLKFNIQGGPSVAPTSVTAVPEPETYAMMLVGLGALGFMGRRRKAK